MGIHLLYFHLTGAERFGDIHGAEIARLVREDLTRRFAALSRVLLSQHDVLSGLAVPEFGVWAVPFGTRRLEIAADEREQMDSIAAAGRELGRAALAEELGSAVALHAGLEVGTLDVEGRDGSPRWMSRLRAFLRRGPPSRPAATEAERAVLRGVIAGGLELSLQEIVSLDTRRTDSYEALVRGPEGPLRGPDRLLAEAARCGLRARLELASFEAALELAPRLPGPARLAVNLSPELFAAPAVRRLAEQPELAGRLVLEITEHLPIPDAARLIRDLAPLRRRGAKIALDDAGCGYLNMELVRALRPDIVKLCITVTRRIVGGPRILTAVRATVAAIRASGALALAEGVETPRQARLARECGCALAQGWLFGRPRPAAVVLASAAGSRILENKVTAPA